jgi:Cu+-exporting ATPase
MSIHRELLPAKTQSKDPGITVSYSEPEAEDARPVTRACRLSLKGLTCHGCVSTVRSSLESSPGVIDVSVSFQSLSACIQYNHKKATTDEFIKRIQETGYEAALLVESEDWKSSWLNAAASRESTIEDQTTSLTFSVATTGVVSALETLFPWLMPNTTLAVIWLALTFVITSLAVALLARPIHREAFYALRHWKLSSSLLSSLGLITVLCSVMYERVSLQTFAPERGVGGHTLTSTCMLIAVLNGSRMIKAVLAQRSARFATNLAQATPHTAKVVTNLSLKDPESSSIPAELLRPGDYVLIHPDSPFPADGTVVCGKSTAMRTILNGELAAEPVEQGSSIYAGCMNGGGQVIARVLRTGKQTLLSQALRALSQANNGRKATDHGTDKYLAWFSSFTLCFTALVGIFHTMIGVTFRIVLSKMATVLLCACPCAMGVGIPICFMIATGKKFCFSCSLHRGLTWCPSKRS